MSNLTENFQLKEFLKERQRPTQHEIYKLKLLCHTILQPLRNHYNSPIIITSGLRSIDENQRIGGSEVSQHLFGEAADFYLKNHDLENCYMYIKDNLPYWLLIFYPKRNFIHVSIVPEKTNQPNKHWISYRA